MRVSDEQLRRLVQVITDDEPPPGPTEPALREAAREELDACLEETKYDDLALDLLEAREAYEALTLVCLDLAEQVVRHRAEATRLQVLLADAGIGSR